MMKRSAYFTFLLSYIAFSSFAQDEPQVLIRNTEEQTTTFYWGPEFKLHAFGSRMREDVGPLFGGTFGMIINRKVILGISGSGKISRTTFYGHYIATKNGNLIDNPDQKMAVGYGYGGIVMGAQFKSNMTCHITFTSLFGIGSANEYIIEPDGDHGTTFNSPGFGIVEPCLNIEVNITRNLRAEAGLGFRYIAANRFEQLNSQDLSGVTFKTAIKIGRY